MTKACCDISFEILLPFVSAIMSCRQAEKRKRERTPWQEEGVGKNQILWIWFQTTATIHILQGRDKLRVWDWHTHIVYLCCMLSHVWLFVTLWTVTARFFCPWDSPDKNTGVGCHFLLQGIFPTQESKLHLLQVPCVAGGFFTAEPPGKPTIYKTDNQGESTVQHRELYSTSYNNQ